MTIALLVITNGRRDCVERTVRSATANLTGDIGLRVMFDDSGDWRYRAWLSSTFPQFDLITAVQPVGFGDAIRRSWMYLRRHSAEGLTHVFHLEDDFTFNEPVDLDRMARLLDGRPYLAQMALRRQAWNAEEIAAGGVVEAAPSDYTQFDDLDGNMWLEHRRFFTTNPSLYRAALLAVGWPDGAHSEGRFTRRLLDGGLPPDIEPAAVRFGYWGARADPPLVEHIGTERVGSGY